MKAGYIAGGLLSGFGQAVAQDGAARREAFYRQLESQASDAREQRSETAATQRQDASFEHDTTMAEIQNEQRDRESQGMLKDTIERVDPKDHKVHVIGVDNKGNPIHDYGVKPPQEFAPDRPDDKLYQYDDGSGTIKWGTRDEALGKGSPPPAGVQKEQAAADASADSLAEEDATTAATTEASSHAGWGSTDSTDFKGANGSRDTWITNRAKVIADAKKNDQPVPPPDYEGDGSGTNAAPAASATSTTTPTTMSGGPQPKGAQPAAAPGAKPADGNPAAKPKLLKGGGTKEKPYTPTSQAEVDWIKANAPVGTVAIMNGKTYVK